MPAGIAIAATSGIIYVADTLNNRIVYFTATGTYLGYWGSLGSGNGQFDTPYDVDVAPDANVYVADLGNNRIQYFNATGSYIGKWGSSGSGNGEFIYPNGLCLSVTGSRIYVADRSNNRVQYFNRNMPAVEPASLGRVKALFR